MTNLPWDQSAYKKGGAAPKKKKAVAAKKRAKKKATPVRKKAPAKKAARPKRPPGLPQAAPRPASWKQIQYVESLQAKAGMSDSELKAMIKKATGGSKRASSLTSREVSAVIDLLKDTAVSKGVAVRGRSLRGRHAASVNYQRGDYVVWGRPGGQKTLSVVTRVNDRTLSVRTAEQRGFHRVRAIGGRWTVPYSMIRKATQAEIDAGVAVQTRAPRRPRWRSHPYDDNPFGYEAVWRNPRLERDRVFENLMNRSVAITKEAEALLEKHGGMIRALASGMLGRARGPFFAVPARAKAALLGDLKEAISAAHSAAAVVRKPPPVPRAPKGMDPEEKARRKLKAEQRKQKAYDSARDQFVQASLDVDQGLLRVSDLLYATAPIPRGRERELFEPKTDLETKIRDLWWQHHEVLAEIRQGLGAPGPSEFERGLLGLPPRPGPTGEDFGD